MSYQINEDKVICSVCKKEMFADDFAEHAVNMHPDEVCDLLDDNAIIEGLSDWVK